MTRTLNVPLRRTTCCCLIRNAYRRPVFHEAQRLLLHRIKADGCACAALWHGPTPGSWLCARSATIQAHEAAGIGVFRWGRREPQLPKGSGDTYTGYRSAAESGEHG